MTKKKKKVNQRLINANVPQQKFPGDVQRAAGTLCTSGFS